MFIFLYVNIWITLAFMDPRRKKKLSFFICHDLKACLRPHGDFFNVHTRCSCRFSTKPSCWTRYNSSFNSPLQNAYLTSIRCKSQMWLVANAIISLFSLQVRMRPHNLFLAFVNRFCNQLIFKLVYTTIRMKIRFVNPFLARRNFVFRKFN